MLVKDLQSAYQPLYVLTSSVNVPNNGSAHTPAANQKGGGFTVPIISQPIFVLVFPAKRTGVKYLRSRFAITPASQK